VVTYTMVGGLKATILTDWAHTFILLIILIIFALTAYASHDVLGSPGAVYDLLVEAAARHPVAGNKNGSYLTMQSREGAIFFVINIVGEFLHCACPMSMILETGRCHLRSARVLVQKAQTLRGRYGLAASGAHIERACYASPRL
jgi:hypothetical protein